MTPFVMVIFGATGDLTHNKLIPALFSLFKQQLLPQDFFIVGFARRSFSDEAFHSLFVDKIVDEDLASWQAFTKHLYYQQGVFTEEAGYRQLIEKLNSFDQHIGACLMRLFYLATPPDNYEPILSFLQSTKLSEGCGQGSDKWTKLAIEKPFGKDLQTARTLDRKLAEIFEERQIFRVDHYLAKETVQNMLAFRFANGIFEPVWNNKFIDHVQITFAEAEGVERRGKFFDGVGMLRDVAQNHLMQLLAAVVMEQPRSFEREAVREARAKAIEAIRCITPEGVKNQVVRGQYAGYQAIEGVTKDSATETFVAMKFTVATERFSGVPFYVRTGKRLAQEVMEISIVFIQTCHLLFKEYGCPEIGNVLTIRIQPDEGIRLRVITKEPGTKLALKTVDMKFSYQEEFGGRGADAYEKLLLDIFAGDQMLFNRSDELEHSWEFITDILTGWSAEAGSGSARDSASAPVYSYLPGSWGPQEADELIEKDGRKWL